MVQHEVAEQIKDFHSDEVSFFSKQRCQELDRFGANVFNVMAI